MSSALEAHLRKLIAEEGHLTFARFMELALYHPEFGYYSTGLRIGRAGDYLTAPEVHPIFGWTIARQVRELWEFLDNPSPFTLIEFGPGPGTLILTILEELQRSSPALLTHLRYYPVELSTPAIQELERRFATAGFSSLLLDQLIDPVTGLILANEVLDALPVHRLRWHKGQLWELYVTWQDGQFREVPGPLSDPALKLWFDRLAVQLEEGQSTELCLAAVSWLKRAASILKRGYLLIFDYGYPAPERYNRQRFPTGTIRTYYRHTVSDDPFRAPGEHDITAHVDFSLLQLAAKDQGLSVLGFTTQAEFLAQAGLGELLVRLQRMPGITAEQYLSARAAAVHLLDPRGMGRFHVLLLGKAAPQQAVPSGFRPRHVTGYPLSRSEPNGQEFPTQPGS